MKRYAKEQLRKFEEDRAWDITVITVDVS
jgi:hypothetical protein